MASNTRSSAKNRFNDDPVDELKRRSRRRLVGAIALFFAAIVVVPALVETETEQTPADVELVLPDKPVVESVEVNAQKSATVDTMSASAPLVAAPVQSSPEKESLDLIYPTEQKSKLEPKAESEHKPDSKTDSKKVEKLEPKPEQKTENKPVETKKPEKAEKVEKIEKTESKPKKSEDLIASFADEEGPSITLFWVQVAAVGDKSRADQLRNELSGKGFAARVEASGSLYRVRVGPFTNQDKAEHARGQLSAAGHDGRVVR